MIMSAVSRRMAMFAVLAAVAVADAPQSIGAVYAPLGTVQHEWGEGAGDYQIKWSFLGTMPTGVTNADVWDGVKVDMVNSQNPIDGNYYLKNSSGEYFVLYQDALFTTPLTQNATWSYYGGSNTGDLVGGHDQASAGDTPEPGDPRASSSHPDHIANPSHMWAPGNTNGNELLGGITLEIKAPANSISFGTEVELVDSFWDDLNDQTYYVETSTADSGQRYLLWKDAAFTVPVVPTNPNAVGDYITSIGGDGSGYWQGYLSNTLNGRLVKPAAIEVIPEPTTLLIWSLLAGLGMGLGWRRRK